MPKQNLQLVTLNLIEGDRETIREFYPKHIPWSTIVRALVNRHCKALREAANRKEIDNEQFAKRAAESVDISELTSGDLGGEETE
jgi:hypothetical protein